MIKQSTILIPWKTKCWHEHYLTHTQIYTYTSVFVFCLVIISNWPNNVIQNGRRYLEKSKVLIDLTTERFLPVILPMYTIYIICLTKPLPLGYTFICLTSSYRKFHNNETALVCVHDDILRVINDSSESTSLIMLDLSAAFDTIGHDYF